MWVDTLETKFAGKDVQVVRAIESPATPDEMTICFGDSSRLLIRVDAPLTDDEQRQCISECHAAEFADKKLATRLYGNMVAKVYRLASAKHLDVDF